MTHEVLPHGRVRFTRDNGSTWLFKLAGIREVGMVLPLPTPKAVAGIDELEQPERVEEHLPPALRRARLETNIGASAALLEVTALSPKIVPDSQEIAEGEDAAYLCELGMDAIEMANTILRLSGFEGETLRPFSGDGEPGAVGPGGEAIRETPA